MSFHESMAISAPEVDVPATVVVTSGESTGPSVRSGSAEWGASRRGAEVNCPAHGGAGNPP
jgi:hypothetical protein